MRQNVRAEATRILTLEVASWIARLLGTDDALGLDDIARPPAHDAERPLQPGRSLAQSERAMIDAALKRYAFNVSRAAEELGLTRAALYRRMARYGL